MTTQTPAPVRGVGLLGTTAALFAIGLILEIWGGVNFPASAPVEQIYWGLIVIDIAAGFVVATTGAIIASRKRRRLEGASVLTIVGLILVGVALAGWIWMSGIGILVRLPTGERGRYMLDAAGAVFFGIPWIVGTHALRVRVPRRISHQRGPRTAWHRHRTRIARRHGYLCRALRPRTDRLTPGRQVLGSWSSG